MNRLQKAALVLLFALMTAFACRGILEYTSKHLVPAKYVAGLSPSPYQQRVLMIPVERAALRSHWIAQHAAHRKGALHDPGNWPIAGLGLLSLAACGILAIFIYRRLSENRQLQWLVYPCVIVAPILTYTLHPGTSPLYPYDLPSMFFFTVALALIVYGRVWWAVLLMPIATLNRETTLLLVPAVLLSMASKRTRLIAAGLMLACWVVVTHWEKTHVPGVGNEGGWSVIRNFRTLADPTEWDQIASACGFLWIVPVFFFRDLPRVARRYFWILPLWLVPMFLKGGIQESRVFGELVPLVSVLAILALEGRIPVVVDPPTDAAITSHVSRLDDESRAKGKSADLDANHGVVREHSRA